MRTDARMTVLGLLGALLSLLAIPGKSGAG
jgi:hypothetical protein